MNTMLTGGLVELSEEELLRVEGGDNSEGKQELAYDIGHFLGAAYRKAQEINTDISIAVHLMWAGYQFGNRA